MRQKYARSPKSGTWFSEVAHKSNNTVMSFEEYSERVLSPMIFRDEVQWAGRYGDILKRWNELFGRDKLLVLSYDELREDPDKFQWRVREFLGHNYTGSLPQRNTKSYEGKLAVLPDRAKRALGPRFASKNYELYELLEKVPGPWMEQRPFQRFVSYANYESEPTGPHPVEVADGSPYRTHTS